MAPPDEIRCSLNAAMDRYADGDESAFGEVYDLLAPRLLAFFMRQVRDTAWSEDLVQQTLLQMHAARRNYARGSDVVPWAFAIGRNILIDARRKTKKECLFQTAEDNAAAIDQCVDRSSMPDGIASTKQIARRVRAELERLPESQRAAYNLVRGEGLSVAETAEVLGTTQGAVKLRVHRVYEALRSLFVEEDDPVTPEGTR